MRTNLISSPFLQHKDIWIEKMKVIQEIINWWSLKWHQVRTKLHCGVSISATGSSHSPPLGGVGWRWEGVLRECALHRSIDPFVVNKHMINNVSTFTWDLKMLSSILHIFGSQNIRPEQTWNSVGDFLMLKISIKNLQNRVNNARRPHGRGKKRRQRFYLLH